MNDAYRKAIEQAMPCYILHRVAESMLQKEGMTIREDLLHALRAGMLSPLKSDNDLDFKARLVVMEKDGYTIASAANSDTLRELLISASMWVTKMVDDGVFTDATNSAVLTALTLLEEQREFPEGWGECKRSSEQADTIMNRCLLMGYYVPEKHQIN